MNDDWIEKFKAFYNVSISELYGETITPPEKPNNYAEIIAKLLIDTADKGGNPLKALNEECERFMQVLISDDIKQGLDIDLERYTRLMEKFKRT